MVNLPDGALVMVPVVELSSTLLELLIVALNGLPP